ncbi:hypothetical protein KCU60_g13, partial [Aureobasidium melanogenum]
MQRECVPRDRFNGYSMRLRNHDVGIPHHNKAMASIANEHPFIDVKLSITPSSYAFTKHSPPTITLEITSHAEERLHHRQSDGVSCTNHSNPDSKKCTQAHSRHI